jgi:hypothetical protein
MSGFNTAIDGRIMDNRTAVNLLKQFGFLIDELYEQHPSLDMQKLLAEREANFEKYGEHFKVLSVNNKEVNL